MIEKMSGATIKDAVEIHIECFKDSFLTSLDRGVLTCMYENYISSELGCAYVCIVDGKVVGLAAGTVNPSVYYNQMLKKRGLRFLWLMLKRAVRDPKILVSMARRNYSGFFRPDKSENAYRKASFDVIGVKKEYRTSGIALQLMESLFNEFKERGVSEVTLGVLESNKGLRKFYEIIGLKILRIVKHPSGENLYIYVMRFDQV